VIVISDITRPTPSARLLPHLLAELRCDQPRILIASGNHRAHTPAELRKLIGAVELPVEDHDHRAPDLVLVGTTRRGTPIHVNRRYHEADVRVIVGQVAFHPFAGYSGGAKLVVPGLSSDETIRINHARALDPAARSGHLDGNPVREDLEEGLALCPPSFALHVVLDLDGVVVGASAGNAIASHRHAVSLHDQWYRPALPARAGAAVVSAGGFPKDLDFRQACKALEYAARGVEPGGELLLIAECGDGVGSAEMQALWSCARTVEELIATLERDNPPGAQRVYPIARLCRDYRVSLCSALSPTQTGQLLLHPVDDPQRFLDDLANRSVHTLFLPSTGIEPDLPEPRGDQP
jgi:nickel-dependent lactate racemase